jgi:bifunctional DNA-binding transcriptional regulator/antitoxin component of YhaV-PrlF toxin-antitoxin module
MSGKGQVVIPQTLRKKLGLEPKTKLLVYEYRNMLVLQKLELPDIEKKMEAVRKRIDARIAKYGALTQEDIEEEIQQYRREKARQQ